MPYKFKVSQKVRIKRTSRQRMVRPGRVGVVKEILRADPFPYFVELKSGSKRIRVSFAVDDLEKRDLI